MKLESIVRIIAILASVFIISLYLNIQDSTLDSLIRSPYLLLIPLIAGLVVLFGLWSHLRKKSLAVPIWLLFVVTCVASTALISQQFQVLELSLPSVVNTFFVFGFNLFLHLLVAAIILLSTKCVGDLFLKEKSSFSSTTISVFSGMAILMLLASVLSLIGLLNIFTVGLMLILALFLQRKSILPFLRQTLSQTYKIGRKDWTSIIFLSVLVTMLGYISIMTIKPMAMGHDGFELYMYLTKQVADSGSLIKGFRPYPWATYLSLPDILFGQHSFSLFLGHIFGFLNIALVLRLLPPIQHKTLRYLFILLLISSPFVLFHFYMDEKIDFMLCGVILTALIILKEGVLDNSLKIQIPGISNQSHSAIYFVAFLLGSALSMKYTSVYYILAILPAILVYKKLRLAALGSGILVSSLILNAQFVLRDSHSFQISDVILGVLLFVCGLGLMIKDIKGSLVKTKFQATPILLSLTIFIIPLAPWIFKNINEHGSFTIQNVLEGKKESLPLLDEDKIGFNNLPNERGYDVSAPKSVFMQHQEVQLSTVTESAEEELIRYQGWESEQLKWLTLPGDILFGSNQPNNTANHLGIIFMLLLMLFFFFHSRNTWWKFAIYFFALLVGLIIMNLGLIDHWAHMIQPKSIDTQFSSGTDGTIVSQILSYPGKMIWALSESLDTKFFDSLPNSLNWAQSIIILLVLLLGYFSSKKLKPNHALLAVFSLSALAFWMITGFGIVWYIMPVWIILLGLAFSTMDSSFTRPWISIGIAFSVIQIVFNLAIMSVSGYKEQPRQVLFPKVLLDHSLVLFPEENGHLKNLNGPYREAYRILSRSNDKIYMINTPFSYMINSKKNNIVRDDYLNEFVRYTSKNPNRDNFYHILKYVGVRYIIYDIRTPNKLGTQSEQLSRKCAQFLEYITGHDNIELVVTDNVVESTSEKIVLSDGRSVRGKYSLKGRTLNLGTFAMFELK